MTSTITLKDSSGKEREYILVILKVDEADEYGRPSKVTVGYDDTVFQTEQGMQFWTAWIPVEMAEKEKAQS